MFEVSAEIKITYETASDRETHVSIITFSKAPIHSAGRASGPAAGPAGPGLGRAETGPVHAAGAAAVRPRPADGERTEQPVPVSDLAEPGRKPVFQLNRCDAVRALGGGACLAFR
eukprot:scaffold297144_cov32-Prasinocladus_malaysianus.AAC.1